MAKILVSIISKQTLPNVYFIKNNPADKYVFIISRTMEQDHYADDIKIAAGLSEYDFILIDDNSLDKIERELERYSFNFDYNDVVVNATGGTKIIFLAVYRFFVKKKCAIYYLDVNDAKFLCLHPKETFIETEKFLTLDEYFKSYGNTITDIKPQMPLKSYDIVLKFKNECFEKYREIISLFVRFQNKSKIKNAFKKGKISLKDEEFNETLRNCSLLDKLDDIDSLLKTIDESIENLSYKVLKFVTGGWFEEYIYYTLAKAANGFITEKDYKLGMNITHNYSNTSNELDISFIYKNTLHVIECKTSVAKNSENGNILGETIYKQAALLSDVGLTPCSHLVIYEPVASNSLADHKKKARMFKINIIEGVQKLSDEELLKQFRQIFGQV